MSIRRSVVPKQRCAWIFDIISLPTTVINNNYIDLSLRFWHLPKRKRIRLRMMMNVARETEEQLKSDHCHFSGAGNLHVERKYSNPQFC